MNNVWFKHIQSINILEIGCEPGALAGALSRWYPDSEIVGIDRNSAFLDFARTNVKGIQFIEGEKFYSEQLRVLKPGGICIVLSARRGIYVSPTLFRIPFLRKILRK